jgi:hypothetical protein
MAKTINAFVADQGEVAITISAANVSAIAAFTTAEEIVIDGAVRSFERTNNPERSVESTRVTGSTTPIVTAGDTVPHETWELVLVDDYHEGAAGEWGTDLLAAVEIFEELFAARQDPGGLQCTPAGGATGDIETTLVAPRIVAVGQPVIDADATVPATVTVLIAAESHTSAAHA